MRQRLEIRTVVTNRTSAGRQVRSTITTTLVDADNFTNDVDAVLAAYGLTRGDFSNGRPVDVLELENDPTFQPHTRIDDAAGIVKSLAFCLHHNSHTNACIGARGGHRTQQSLKDSCVLAIVDEDSETGSITMAA